MHREARRSMIFFRAARFAERAGLRGVAAPEFWTHQCVERRGEFGNSTARATAAGKTGRDGRRRRAPEGLGFTVQLSSWLAQAWRAAEAAESLRYKHLFSHLLGGGPAA